MCKCCSSVDSDVTVFVYCWDLISVTGGGYASSGHRGWKSVVTEDQQRLETDIVQLRDANRVLQERVLELEHELSTTQERLKGSLSSAALAAETTAKKFGELQERCLSAETNAATMQTLCVPPCVHMLFTVAVLCVGATGSVIV